jgi:hypothetical protein
MGFNVVDVKISSIVRDKTQGTFKVLGTDFYWNTIVEKDGVLYRLEFNHFTKRTKWVKIQ